MTSWYITLSWSIVIIVCSSGIGERPRDGAVSGASVGW